MPASTLMFAAAPVTTPARSASRWRTAEGDLRPLLVILIMAVTRAVIAWEWIGPQQLALGDVHYYGTRTAALAEVGIEVTMREYPTPMVWLFSVPHLLGGGSEWGYAIWFVVCILVADLAFCTLLARSRSHRHGWAIALWSVACMALGPLIWLRFDLVPAVIVGAALLLAARRTAVAGSLLALGAGTKLWPGVFFPLLLNRPGDDRRRWVAPTLGFVGTGIVLVITSLIAGGWTRLISPLVWQTDRGLQIESVPASPLMAARALDPQRWRIEVSQYQAFEIFGDHVQQFLAVADVLTIIGVVLGIAVVVQHWRRRYATSGDWVVGASIAILAIVGLLIVTNKTLSPQYVVWLAGPLAALIAVHQADGRASTVPVVRWSVIVLVTAALTHAVFPYLYDYVNGLADDPVGIPLTTAALILRNLLLVVMTVDTLRYALRSRLS